MIKRLLIVLTMACCCLLLNACKYHVSFDKQGLQQVKTELIKKFGKNAWYSEITILSVSKDETALRIKETKDPNSLRAKSWLKQSEDWIPQDNVMLQFNDHKPKKHLFQLKKDKISLSKLAELIQQSNKKLQSDGIKNTHIHFASIQSVSIAKADAQRIVYNISYQSKKGDKSYSFVYDMNGHLASFNH